MDLVRSGSPGLAGEAREPADDLGLAMALELASHAVFSRVERRPWGLILHNRDNPDNHDANSARGVDTAEAVAVIDEVVAFYRALGITPRVKVDRRTRPLDMVDRLRVRGFQAAGTGGTAMVWRPGDPRPLAPPGVCLRAATAADIRALALIRAEAFGYSTGWIEKQVGYQMADPFTRYHLALVDGEPAACVSAYAPGPAANAVASPPGSVWAAETPPIPPGAAIVNDVATRPAFQRRGVASALIARVQAEASGPVLLFAAAENAERLYRRAGFRPAGFWEATSCWLPG